MPLNSGDGRGYGPEGRKSLRRGTAEAPASRWGSTVTNRAASSSVPHAGNCIGIIAFTCEKTGVRVTASAC
jgi:hypothetical protein